MRMGVLFQELEADNLVRIRETVTNVAAIPQRSPFRYPGGKTWLIPIVRKWLRQYSSTETMLIEPFAGGGIVSLTAAFEGLSREIIMAELDEEISAVWKTVLGENNEWLANKIYEFELNRQNVIDEFERPNKSVREVAFATILKNRTFHGGIIAKGAGLLKHGENGKGISSRWYPKTLRDRILTIRAVREKISFIEGSAFEVIQQHINDVDCCFFIDPPYTVAGKRLYTHFEIDHEGLFELVSKIKGHFLMTYDDTKEIKTLADRFNLRYTTIPMKTTHHLRKFELLITDHLR